MDGFQSAHKAGHSCETALLRVYNNNNNNNDNNNNNNMYLKSKIQRIKIQVLWTIYVKRNPHNNT